MLFIILLFSYLEGYIRTCLHAIYQPMHSNQSMNRLARIASLVVELEKLVSACLPMHLTAQGLDERFSEIAMMTARTRETSPSLHILEPSKASKHLLEYLSVCPLVALPANGDRLIPRPHVVDELLVLGLGRVEFGELVALVVRRYVECGKRFLSADEECTFDDAVVCHAVY